MQKFTVTGLDINAGKYKGILNLGEWAIKQSTSFNVNKRQL